MMLPSCANGLVADIMKIAKLAARSAIATAERIQHGSADNTPAADDSGLRPGQATVVEADDGPLGVFCDAAGQLRAVRARCTHINWPLEFNGSSQTWDCPRHGASFTTDGNVIRGPAAAALEPVCLPGNVCAALSLTRPMGEGQSGVDTHRC